MDEDIEYIEEDFDQKENENYDAEGEYEEEIASSVDKTISNVQNNQQEIQNNYNYQQQEEFYNEDLELDYEESQAQSSTKKKFDKVQNDKKLLKQEYEDNKETRFDKKEQTQDIYDKIFQKQQQEYQNVQLYQQEQEQQEEDQQQYQYDDQKQQQYQNQNEYNQYDDQSQKYDNYQQYDNQNDYEDNQQEIQENQDFQNDENYDDYNVDYYEQYNQSQKLKQQNLEYQQQNQNSIDGPEENCLQIFEELVEQGFQDINQGMIQDGLEKIEIGLCKIQFIEDVNLFYDNYIDVIKALNKEGVHQMNKGFPQDRQIIFEKCRDLSLPGQFEQINTVGMQILTANNFGCLLRRQGNVQEAMDIFQDALQIAEENDTTLYAGLTHLNLSAILSQMQDHTGCLQQATQAVNLLQTDLQIFCEGQLLQDLQGNVDFEELVSNFAMAYYNQGIAREYFKQYEEADESYDNAVNVSGINLGENHRLSIKLYNLYQKFKEKYRQIQRAMEREQQRNKIRQKQRNSSLQKQRNNSQQRQQSKRNSVDRGQQKQPQIAKKYQAPYQKQLGQKVGPKKSSRPQSGKTPYANKFQQQNDSYQQQVLYTEQNSERKQNLYDKYLPQKQAKSAQKDNNNLNQKNNNYSNKYVSNNNLNKRPSSAKQPLNKQKLQQQQNYINNNNNYSNNENLPPPYLRKYQPPQEIYSTNQYNNRQQPSQGLQNMRPSSANPQGRDQRFNQNSNNYQQQQNNFMQRNNNNYQSNNLNNRDNYNNNNFQRVNQSYNTEQYNNYQNQGYQQQRQLPPQPLPKNRQQNIIKNNNNGFKLSRDNSNNNLSQNQIKQYDDPHQSSYMDDDAQYYQKKSQQGPTKRKQQNNQNNTKDQFIIQDTDHEEVLQLSWSDSHNEPENQEIKKNKQDFLQNIGHYKKNSTQGVYYEDQNQVISYQNSKVNDQDDQILYLKQNVSCKSIQDLTYNIIFDKENKYINIEILNDVNQQLIILVEDYLLEFFDDDIEPNSVFTRNITEICEKMLKNSKFTGKGKQELELPLNIKGQRIINQNNQVRLCNVQNIEGYYYEILFIL